MANEKRLIDANALMAYFEEQYNLAMDDPDPVSGYVMAALRCCTEYFKAIPTVDAKPVVHGRWEHDAVELCNPFVDALPIWGDVMQCSVCKEYIEGSHGTNYCPNCGAKMDGDGNA